MPDLITETFIPLEEYDLATTLSSGQVFRWHQTNDGWEGIIGYRWVQLVRTDRGIRATTIQGTTDWRWLTTYLQANVDLESVIRTFPRDQPMKAAVKACRGLRLLRQDPWECLASFILSSSKQIPHIQQIVATISERYGKPIDTPRHRSQAYAFPQASAIASCTERELRDCRMGYRAPYLLETARIVSSSEIRLEELNLLKVEEARAELMRFPGVGRKIADCVLLFAYGFPTAFPVDVWVTKALNELYFPGRRMTKKALEEFSETHFGPHAGYAQQYLFHYMRTQAK